MFEILPLSVLLFVSLPKATGTALEMRVSEDTFSHVLCSSPKLDYIPS